MNTNFSFLLTYFCHPFNSIQFNSVKGKIKCASLNDEIKFNDEILIIVTSHAYNCSKLNRFSLNLLQLPRNHSVFGSVIIFIINCTSFPSCTRFRIINALLTKSIMCSSLISTIHPVVQPNNKKYKDTQLPMK